MKIEPFKTKVWLSSPTMHGEEMKYIAEAYETNWMSTVGMNIDAIEQSVCQKLGCKYAVALSAGTASLHMAVKLAGDYLISIKRNCVKSAKCTCLYSFIRCTKRFCRILNKHRIVLPTDISYLVYLPWSSIQMRYDDSLNLRI